MLRAPLAALLCLAVAAPSPAQVRAAAPVRVPSTPAALALPSASARLPPGAGLSLAASPVYHAAPSLGAAPSPLPAPSLSAAPSLAPSAPLAAAVPAAAASAPGRLAPAGPSAPEARAAAESVPFAGAAPFAAALSAAQEGPKAGAETGRGALENAWTGEAPRPAASDDGVLAGAPSAPRPLARSFGGRMARAAGAVGLPLAAGSATGLLGGGLLASALPFLQGLGAFVAAYGVARVSRWLLNKLAARYGWSKHTVSLVRILIGAAAWGAAVGYVLSLLGVADNTLLTTFGGSGAAMALAVKDVVGNLVHGVHFLFSRPFTVGSRVTIDEVPGTVHELSLRYVVLKTSLEPAYVYYTYSELIGKAVTVHERYETKEVRLRLSRPALPRGLMGALRDAATPRLWRPAIFSALGIAALSMLPMARGWFAGKGITTWFELALPWANFALILFLARSLSQAAKGAIARLAQRYEWSPPATTLVKLAASVLIWSVAGSFALNAVGVSWASLATTLSISTIILGIAVNDFVSSLFHAFIILLLKPFQIGDRIAVGKHEGEVLEINFQHVVLKKDDQSHILLPYASVKGFRSPREHGAKANNE